MKKATLFKTYARLDRGVYVLFLARIVSSMGNFVFPFLTMFLTNKLHFTPARAGSYIVIVGLAIALSARHYGSGSFIPAL